VGSAPVGRAEPEIDQQTFTLVADTYVDAAMPTTGFGSAATLRADASPVKRSFLLFNLDGVAGRSVLGVSLRLHAATSSPFGGGISALSSVDWTKSTTFDTQPPVDGPQLAELGSVNAGGDYDVDLGQAVAGDGLVALAIDSISSTEARWSSRNTIDPPLLTVDVPTCPGPTGMA
jgi:hypothetical protein